MERSLSFLSETEMILVKRKLGAASVEAKMWRDCFLPLGVYFLLMVVTQVPDLPETSSRSCVAWQQIKTWKIERFAEWNLKKEWRDDNFSS